MHCEILETLYLRANGDVPCNDDAGESVILGQVGGDGWSVAEIVTNPSFEHIRRELRAGRAPWEECQRCAWLRPHQPFRDRLAERHIVKLQIEPSLACNLRCPGCSNQIQIRQRPRPFRMDHGSFVHFLESLQAGGFGLGEIEYCGQGEPILNPELWRFIEAGRRLFPTTAQRLITNGNGNYRSVMRDQLVDEVFVSCDGLHQDSYEKYRIRGQVDRALQFMIDARAASPDRRQTVNWKYILFEFNDSDEEIAAAQHKAHEIGVDALLFVATHSLHKSLRWTDQNLASLPRLYPFVRTSATPVHAVSERSVRVVTPLTGRTRRLAGECTLLRASDDGLQVGGWLTVGHPITSVALIWDGGRPVAADIAADKAGGVPARIHFDAHLPTGSVDLSPGPHTIDIRVGSRRWTRSSHLLRQGVEISQS